MADHIFKHCDQHSMFSPTCPKCIAAEHEKQLNNQPSQVAQFKFEEVVDNHESDFGGEQT